LYYLFPLSCEELAQENSTEIAVPQFKHLDVCITPTVWTSSVIIILVVGITTSLLLLAVIVHGIRRLYKPKRSINKIEVNTIKSLI